MASIMDILKIKPFVEVSVGQLLWGYEDPLLKLAKDVVPKEQKLPYEEFGLMYGKNSTSTDRVTVWTGADDITQYGIIEKYNGRTHLPHYTEERCNRLNGTDGSIFPPHITQDTILHIYDKDLCRLLPLSFEKEVCFPGILESLDLINLYCRLKDVVAFLVIDSLHQKKYLLLQKITQKTCVSVQLVLHVLHKDYSMYHYVNMVRILKFFVMKKIY
jgi:hypothetical protein